VGAVAAWLVGDADTVVCQTGRYREQASLLQKRCGQASILWRPPTR